VKYGNLGGLGACLPPGKSLKIKCSEIESASSFIYLTALLGWLFFRVSQSQKLQGEGEGQKSTWGPLVPLRSTYVKWCSLNYCNRVCNCWQNTLIEQSSVLFRWSELFSQSPTVHSCFLVLVRKAVSFAQEQLDKTYLLTLVLYHIMIEWTS